MSALGPASSISTSNPDLSTSGADGQPAAPLRILHLASTRRWAGAADPAARLAAAQQQAGHAVLFGCDREGHFGPTLDRRGLTRADGFHFDRHLNPGRLRQDVALLRALIRQFKPDVVHCHLPPDHWVAALGLRHPMVGSRWRRIPIVRTMHRENAPRTGLANRWLVGKGADMVIAISQSQQRRLIEQVGLPTPRVRWVRCGVDPDAFSPAVDGNPVRLAAGIPADARVVGLVARMQRNGGQHFFLDSIEAVAARVPEAFYLLVGRGELKEEIVERIRRHPLRSRIRRLPVRQFSPAEIYAGMDASVLFSPGSDGSGRSMLEAMACGRPVVGADMGSISDTIEDGVNGYKFRVGDRDDFTRCVVELLHDNARLKDMGAAARRHVAEYHSIAAQLVATRAVYEEALARRAKLLG